MRRSSSAVAASKPCSASSDENVPVRVATWNIRTLRAADRPSFWWTRRGDVASAIRSVGADLWGLQEAWSLQRRWLRRHTFGSGWNDLGRGRQSGGGGEASPIVAGPRFAVGAVTTNWFGLQPRRAGQRLPGASFPRIATIAELTDRTTGTSFVVANTHLDEVSDERRLQSTKQLAEWLRTSTSGPLIVLGDINCTLTEPPAEPLFALGLRPVLGPDDGPTSNGFGDDAHAFQIDHIFVSEHWSIERAWVHTAAGLASDHYPVVADLL